MDNVEFVYTVYILFLLLMTLEELMGKRAYDVIRTLIEENGGTMTYKREGFPLGGAWIIRYKNKEKAFCSTGQRFPGIDELHIPKKYNPQTFYDYKHKLVDNALEKLEKKLAE